MCVSTKPKLKAVTANKLKELFLVKIVKVKSLF